MLLKLLWIVVVAWIIHRVILAGRNLYLIATGRDEIPPAGPPPSRPREDRVSAPPGTAAGANGDSKLTDVEDARWVDL